MIRSPVGRAKYPDARRTAYAPCLRDESQYLRCPEQKVHMGKKRSLIYVPVLHSPEDMGSLASSLPPPGDYGVQVARYWDRVEAEFHSMRRVWDGVRVYQDGLPEARQDIVARVVADVDSPNYRLLRWLASQGADVVGTEDPVLLQEEYELVKASVADDAARRVYAARAAQLLDERDRYIAARIDATLAAGAAGVLFVGLQHNVARVLPADFEVAILRCARELLPAITASLAAQRAAGGQSGRE